MVSNIYESKCIIILFLILKILKGFSGTTASTIYIHILYWNGIGIADGERYIEFYKYTENIINDF